MKPLVYIAGPISRGCQFTNVRKGCELWHQLWTLGIDAYCPHWSAQQQFHTELGHAEWLAYDTQVILPRCDALFRMPGESSGADIEVEWMKEHGKPVFYEISKLAEWYSQYDRNSDVFHGSRSLSGQIKREIRPDFTDWASQVGANMP